MGVRSLSLTHTSPPHVAELDRPHSHQIIVSLKVDTQALTFCLLLMDLWN